MPQLRFPPLLTVLMRGMPGSALLVLSLVGPRGQEEDRREEAKEEEEEEMREETQGEEEEEEREEDV